MVICKTSEPHSEILVLDILGRVVLRIPLPQGIAGQMLVNTESLADGEYTLLIRSVRGALLGHGSFLKIK